MIHQAWYNLSGTIYRYIAFENLVLILLLSLLLFVYFYKNRQKFSGWKNKLIHGLFVYDFMYIAYAFLSHIAGNWQFLLNYTKDFNAVSTIIYLLSIVGLVVLLFYQKKVLPKLLIPIFCIVGLVGPLCVVSPIGARNFFTIYVLEVLLICYLAKEVQLDKNKVVPYFVYAGFLVMLGYFLSIYGYIHLIDYKRLSYIEKQYQAGEKIIAVPYLPYEEYVWVGNFDSVYYGRIFKTRKGMSQDVTFHFMTYAKWVGER